MTLYIVDGDSAGGSLKRILPARDRHVLVWRDALYEGPVPGDLNLAQLSRIRARYWKRNGAFVKRNRELARFRKFDEVRLLFGPTMVCQLSLIQVLDWFSRQDRGAAPMFLTDADYAGWLPSEKLAALLEQKRPVTAAMYRLAQRAWRAFTASDPRKLNEFLRGDSSALPELRRVLLLMAQEYPHTGPGISRIERRLLENLPRPASVAELVASVLRDETFGDVYYFDLLRNLIRGRNQLVAFAEPFAGNLLNHEFHRARILLTDFGRRVLAGEADALAFNGIDRWIGGVHLLGHQCGWRWDAAAQSIVAS